MPNAVPDLLLLFASAQGFFLTVLILHKHGRLLANRFLIALLFLYSANLLHLALDQAGYSSTHPRLLMAAIGVGFLAGPLHYLYAKYLTGSEQRFLHRDWWHFLPFLIYEVVVAIFFRPSEGGPLPAGSEVELDTWISLYFPYHSLLISQFATYLVLTLRLLRRHARQARQVFSSLDRIRLDWLRNITYMVMAFLVVYAVEFALTLANHRIEGYFGLTSLLMAIYIYALGYLAFFKSEVFTWPAPQQPLPERPAAATVGEEAGGVVDGVVDDGTDGGSDEGSDQKYGKSGLSEERARRYQKQLLAVMQDQEPYIDAGLTLNQLAELVGVSPHNLSEVINGQLGQNFFDFVNAYRIERVKRDLVDPKQSHLTILALALDAGFNSKSSFNSIFKKHVGATPSAFRSQQQAG